MKKQKAPLPGGIGSEGGRIGQSDADLRAAAVQNLWRIEAEVLMLAISMLMESPVAAEKDARQAIQELSVWLEAIMDQALEAIDRATGGSGKKTVLGAMLLASFFLTFAKVSLQDEPTEEAVT